MEAQGNKKTGRKTNFVPDPYFYDWCKINLPSRYLFFITDIDMIIRDRKGRIMLIEKKCKKAVPKKSQSITYRMLHNLILKADKTGALDLGAGHSSLYDWTYYGFHLLQFENTSFEDGKAYFDNKEVTEEELKKILSFDSDILKVQASSE